MAAGKEARRKDRLAAIGSKKEGSAIPTPATVGVKNKKKSDKEKNGVELEEDVMDNPTPAMKAILQKRQVTPIFSIPILFDPTGWGPPFSI